MKPATLSRLLCLFLSVLLSLSALSCANTGNGEGETQPSSSEGSITEEPVETEKLYLDNLPETMDWDGYEVRFLTAEETHSVELEEDATGTSQLDATIYDAYWRRNEALLSRMNAGLTLCQKTGYGSFSAAAT